MAKTAAARITAATLQKARKDAAQGQSYEIRDIVCPSLTMRVWGGRRGGVTWTVRAEFAGKEKRYRVGDGEIHPDLARERAVTLKQWTSRNEDPEPLLRQWTTGVVVVDQPRVLGQRVRSWHYEHARSQFLDHIFRTKRPATYDDYSRVLDKPGVPELTSLDGRLVAQIRRQEIAALIAKIHARSESQAAHVKRILGSFWTFLGDDSRRDDTGVPALYLMRLSLPENARKEVGDPNSDVEDDDDVPTELDLGRVLVVARSGVLGGQSSLLLLLLAATVQRRRTIVGAHWSNFKAIGEDIIWSIPPYFRKSANKRRSKRPHVLPLSGWGADTFRALDRLADDFQWLFPIGRTPKGKQPKQPHANPSQVNQLLDAVPGADVGPHGFRRAFASYGQRDLGISEQDAKLVLDHMEGAEPSDVTADFYALDPQLQRKRAMLAAWMAWLDKRAEEAVMADPRLTDIERIREMVYIQRYGEERWNVKLARARRHGVDPFFQVYKGKKARQREKRERESAQLRAVVDGIPS